MARVPRWMQLAHDAPYHVLSREHNRETLFADPDDFRYFLGLLDRYRRRFGFRLYHSCLMTNHLHLLLQLDDPRRLSALVAGLLLAYVRAGISTTSRPVKPAPRHLTRAGLLVGENQAAGGTIPRHIGEQ